MSNFDFDGKRIESRSELEPASIPSVPSAHSSHATLIAELAAERAKVKKLRDALDAAEDYLASNAPANSYGLLDKSADADRSKVRRQIESALAETAE